MRTHEVTEGFKFRDDRTALEYRTDPQRPKLPATWYRVEAPTIPGLAIDEVFRLADVAELAYRLERGGRIQGFEFDGGTVWTGKSAGGDRSYTVLWDGEEESSDEEESSHLTAIGAAWCALGVPGFPGDMMDRVEATLREESAPVVASPTCGTVLP